MQSSMRMAPRCDPEVRGEDAGGPKQLQGSQRLLCLAFGAGQFVSNGEDIQRQELCCVLPGGRGHVGASILRKDPVVISGKFQALLLLTSY